jgi:hypothetical protein
MLDKNYQLNPVFMGKLMISLGKINEFYIQYQDHISKSPNLIYLFIIGAVTETKNGILRISNKIVFAHNE